MTEQQKNYKETLNLPQTDFPMKGNLSKKEPELLAHWKKMSLYERIRKKSGGAPKFILHDGPPYANGNIHIGHALNKILKDVIVKYKTLRGFDAHYLPGWDCHGLPIELQALKEMGKKKEEISQIEFRKKARVYAEKFVVIQKEEFIRLGVFGDWDKPYLTMSYGYQAAIAEAFLKLFEKGYIERRLKPVPWCYDCETALADAELEYEERTDSSIYVAFELNPRDPENSTFLRRSIFGGEPVFVLVWTTTPWTLPANVGMAFHPELKYVVAKTEKGIFIFAEALQDHIGAKLGWKHFEVLDTLDPEREGLPFTHALHPFLPRTSKRIFAEYVSSSEGTGVVHIAPGHGEEDYQFGHLENDLPIVSPVDERGRFTKEFPECEGMNVFKANQKITELLRKQGRLLHQEDYQHSYPHCWRCKNPILFRATQQWFLKVDEQGLRQKVLGEIRDQIQFLPDWGKNRIGSMVESRPDWCLSRQRYWGVPVPILSCQNCGKNFVSETKERILQLFRERGADVWFESQPEEFLGKKPSCCAKPKLEKENDIIDVWFDSGVSHQAVLKGARELTYPCDLYLEGSDQHRGWFQTSLITAVALDKHTPFRSVLTHGFVVDGEGKKMSKSAGNVIAPQEVTEELGSDVLRLWVSSCDYQFDVRLSKEILSRMVEAYRRIRNTFRYLLGNLNDFDPEKDRVPFEEMDSIDRWALGKCLLMVREVTQSYEEFKFHQIYRIVHEFCTIRMSNFYLDALKDRMYTSASRSKRRRSAQTAFYFILRNLVKILAPILPFTCEEVWLCYPIQNKFQSVHETDWPEWYPEQVDEGVLQDWDNVALVRDIVNVEVEKKRMKSEIGSSLEAKVVLRTTAQPLFDLLDRQRSHLAMAFIVSEVELEKAALVKSSGEDVATVTLLPEGKACAVEVFVEKARGKKCERCWIYSVSVGQNPQDPALCAKCVAALKEIAESG